VSVLDEIVADQIRTDLPEIAPGDTVRVSVKVKEGNRERIQVFEGTVMRMRGGGITRSITVRALRSGVGVERTRVNSPRIEKIEVVRHGVVRRKQLTSCASASARPRPSASGAPPPPSRGPAAVASRVPSGAPPRRAPLAGRRPSSA
jgi:large subunit ribosomal protein L19